MSLHGDYDDENVFAKMISGQIPAVTVHEDEHVLCVMDIFPQSPGHTLVIPKERARNLLELSDEAAQAAITRVKAIARAVAKGLDPDGVTVTQFNGAPADAMMSVQIRKPAMTAGRGRLAMRLNVMARPTGHAATGSPATALP